MVRKRLFTVLTVLVILSLVMSGCAGKKQAKVEKLTIMWAQWDPASFLATLAQEYPNAEVEVIQV